MICLLNGLLSAGLERSYTTYGSLVFCPFFRMHAAQCAYLLVKDITMVQDGVPNPAVRFCESAGLDKVRTIFVEAKVVEQSESKS